MSTADIAVAHLLRRIQRDPRLAYFFDPLTESFELLTLAHAEHTGKDVAEFRKTFAATLTFEAPKCRTGECAQGGADGA